ncbi:MAG: 2,3-bisphosphoglycerate-independent phosphoglycerate mutase [Candidatus Saccharibacteria bacterium]
MIPKPLILMILDGWGLSNCCEGNAVAEACPRNFQSFWENYPHTCLEASGLKVGLPAGLMGNSEVGHLNMGAGRVVYQEITRISKAIEDGDFYKNTELNKAVDFALNSNGALHLLGLVSDGGVHSTMEHIYGLLRLAKNKGLDKVFVHAFLDGRDVPPASALDYIESLETTMQEIGVGRVATVIGRYYAMDRDKRWERNQRAYECMVMGKGHTSANAREAIKKSYDNNVTDEFVEPVVIFDEAGTPVRLIKDGDGVIFFNFRADRARQITRAFVDKEFKGFEREYRPDTYYVCMTQYDVTIKAPVAFMPQNLHNTLGEYLSDKGLRQLRIAETEKYAHVTFFFNGGVEEPNLNEDRILIPSPKVATYDLQPEMSAYEVTERVLQEIEQDKYDVIIMNYANPDMVGHTGVMEAAEKAVLTVDDCLGRVLDAVLARQGVVLVTADHGNAELMYSEESGQPHTAHTTNLVPLIIVGEAYKGRNIRMGGSLEDIAPTLLGILELPQPEEMTGRSLIEN